MNLKSSNILKCCIAAILAATGGGAAASPGSLKAAHQAYLDGDFVVLGEEVRETLADSHVSALEKENALELLDKAYEVHGGGSLPAKFVLPPGYSGLQLAFRRFEGPHGPQYQIRFAGVTRDASHLVGLTVRRLPGETLMDKQSGKGWFEIRHDPSAASRGLEEFVIDSEPLTALPGDGVFSLRLELDDGTVSEGFVIARGMAASTGIKILSPAPSATLSDANPLVKWEPIRSPRYVPFERPRVVVHVNREGDNTSLWEYSTGKAGDPTDIRLGAALGPRPQIALKPGDYWLSVDAVESRFFGPVEVLRATRKTQPFHIARP